MNKLLGHPIHYSENVPILGNTNDITLLPPSAFFEPIPMPCAKCGAPATLLLSEHRHFDRDEIYYATQCRKCGETPLKG
jgi:hypothetical protein